MSSQGSPDSSRSPRKRKSPFDSPIAPGLTNKKRRRSLLSLSKEFLERHSQQSNDSSTKCEDEDTRSLTSVSVTSISSERRLFNNSSRDYSSIAYKFGINQRVAKKYYTFLSHQPSVAIIRILPIKRELLSLSELEETVTPSSVFHAKKKGKKKQRSKEHRSSLFSDGPITNNSVLNDTENNSLQNETLENKTPSRKKKLNQRVKENIENYLQTLPDNCDMKQEISQFESSAIKEVDLSRSFNNVSYDSENEFQISKCKKSQKHNERPVQKSRIVTNPFSKDDQALRSSQISEQKKSFWLKKFGSVERSVRKKRFLETFVKKENNSDNESDNELEGVDDFKQENEEVAITNGMKNKETQSKKVNCTRKRIIIPDDDGSDTDVDDQTFDSLSVNCRPLSSMPSSHTNNQDHTHHSQASPLMPFGAGGEERDEEGYIEIDQELDVSFQDDIIDLIADSPVSIEYIAQETTLTSNKLANGNEETSNDNLSDDFVDSPRKLGSPSDRLVIDLTPSSNSEAQIKSLVSSPPSSGSPRRKGKPKITSDKKLENNIIIVPPRKIPRKPSIEISPSSPIVKSNEVQTPSTNADSNQLDSNHDNQQITTNSRTPTTRGLRVGLHQVKCNLNNEESVKEYQNAKTTNAKDVEEDFDSLCRDVTDLSKSEYITLYKGGEDIAHSNDTAVVLSDSNNDAQQIEDPTSLAVSNNKASETASPASHQNSQLNFNKKTPQKSPSILNDSGNTTTPLSQQKTPVRLTRSSINSNTSSPAVGPLLGFTIPRKDPRSNKSVGSATLSERDPRLNRSLSPNKLLGVSPMTDMRVTRSASLQKSPGLSSADPRLTRGQSRPRSDTPTPSINTSPSTEKGEEDKIVDPRLRKRKEREEAEKAAKLAQEQQLLQQSIELTQTEPPQLCQFGQSSPSPERKRNVFQRLGCKEHSPTRGPVQNEFIGIIKSKTASPTKLPYDDDDNISLHPHISDFYDSSDEDDNDSSPRHRKFESERNRSISANTSATIQTNKAPQQRLSVKERIGFLNYKADALSNRKAPISAPSESSTLAPPMQRSTTAANTLLNRQTRFGLGTRSVTQQQSRTSQPNASVTATTKLTNSLFMDSFYQMNTKQMMQDEDKLMIDEQDSEVYVTFDNGTADNEYDHISILDNKPDTTVKGLSDPKYTFFKNQCYRILRDGKCKSELSTCHFHHQITTLLRTAKTKNVEFIKAILDTCIEQNFDYYLDNVWKSILPVMKADNAFIFYEKLYKSNKRSHHFVLELLNYCLTENIHTVDSFLRKVAPIIEDNDSETVQAICAAIKSKLVDGFCWETIKVICKKAAPPRDMVDLVLLQCLKRKKNRTHILEVHDMIKKKMIALDRNRISNNLLKPFYELVARHSPSDTNTEVLSTMPLMNVTNNVINGQSFERLSVNVPKPLFQSTAIPKSTKSFTKRNETLTPRSPDNIPVKSPNENQAQTPIRGESTNFAEYTVKPVDSAEAQSIFRDRFWKLYSVVNCVNNGLNHLDYDYVWEQLGKFTQDEVPDELVKRAFYQILCKDVTISEHHLTEIIKRAVKESSKKSTRILFEVSMHALIDLGNNEFWVMALELLNRLKGFESEVLPTAFILISAEIYLANNLPLDALSLLQRTKLIRTNRDEWLVNDSKKPDEKHRNKLVFILLQALAHVEPDEAFFLFKELMADQYIYYYPIDLSRYLDKFTLLLIMHKRLDLAADIARFVMDNDMSFQKPTYQELLTCLLPVDEVLVNQILEYAVNLGYYNDIQIRQGFTTMILDMNYSEEEIYLILRRLVHKLTINLGPVIPRLKSSHLKVTLVLEDIPTGKRLYKNETLSKINLNKNRHMRHLIGNILATRFSPQIKLSQTKADRFCKIMSRTLVDHLKHWH